MGARESIGHESKWPYAVNKFYEYVKLKTDKDNCDFHKAASLLIKLVSNHLVPNCVKVYLLQDSIDFIQSQFITDPEDYHVLITVLKQFTFDRNSIWHKSGKNQFVLEPNLDLNCDQQPD